MTIKTDVHTFGEKHRKVQRAFDGFSKEVQVAIRLRYNTLADWYRKEVRSKEVERLCEEIKEEIYKALLSMRPQNSQDVEHTARVVIQDYSRNGAILSFDAFIHPDTPEMLRLYFDFGDLKVQFCESVLL